jgi:hypothetical protein
MSEPLALTLGQQFELERMTRVIDSTGDAQLLRGLAKQLLQAWQTQKAATEWVMRQQLGRPSTLAPQAPGQTARSAQPDESPAASVRSLDVL